MGQRMPCKKGNYFNWPVPSGCATRTGSASNHNLTNHLKEEEQRFVSLAFFLLLKVLYT